MRGAVERDAGAAGEGRVSVIGFDSAWTDNPKSPGAVCVIRMDGQGTRTMLAPEPASFARALAVIEGERAASRLCLVAIDQPTIVPNLSGCRPVDRVAASLISWMGGGVQPANRSKTGMFDDAAPIWRFKAQLAAREDPEGARHAASGLFLIEVFPALALADFSTAFCGPKMGPRYNPARRRTFRPSHWTAVVDAVAAFAAEAGVAGVSAWCAQQCWDERPRKTDQDRLDAVICALVGVHWLVAPRERSVMIGDLSSGYMIAPAVHGIDGRLVGKAGQVGVPIDGAVPAASLPVPC